MHNLPALLRRSEKIERPSTKRKSTSTFCFFFTAYIPPPQQKKEKSNIQDLSEKSHIMIVLWLLYLIWDWPRCQMRNEIDFSCYVATVVNCMWQSVPWCKKAISVSSAVNYICLLLTFFSASLLHWLKMLHQQWKTHLDLKTFLNI